MTIKVGDRLPAGTLQEFHEVEENGCSVGPNPVKVEDLTRGKKVVLFGLPGAFTPTCSAKHVPSYLAAYDKRHALLAPLKSSSIAQKSALKRWGTVEDLVGTALFLASPAAVFVTATTLPVDGGYVVGGF